MESRNKFKCRNQNHAKNNVAVKYCPECGEKFDSTSRRTCDESVHNERRKARDSHCVDCGKNLKK